MVAGGDERLQDAAQRVLLADVVGYLVQTIELLTAWYFRLVLQIDAFIRELRALLAYDLAISSGLDDWLVCLGVESSRFTSWPLWPSFTCASASASVPKSMPHARSMHV